MKYLWRKLKAKITGITPCSFKTKHGHDLEFPSYDRGAGWASFKCSKCGKRMTYVSWLGAYID